MATLNVTVNVSAGGGTVPTTIAEYHDMLLARRIASYQTAADRTEAEFLARPDVTVSGDLLTVTPADPLVVYERYNLAPSKYRITVAGSNEAIFDRMYMAERIKAGPNARVTVRRSGFDPNGLMENGGAGIINQDLGGTGWLRVYDNFITRTPSDLVKYADEVVGNLFDLPLPPLGAHADFVDCTENTGVLVWGNVFIAQPEAGIEHQADVDYVNSMVWLRSGDVSCKGNLYILDPGQQNDSVDYSGAAEPPTASAICVGDRVRNRQNGGYATRSATNVQIQDVVDADTGAAILPAEFGPGATAITGQTPLTVSALLAQMEV